jgi:FKBP-type peptidyl-prolyl cis-trans isomerase 2
MLVIDVCTGEKKTVPIPPSMAFGEANDPDNIITIPIEDLELLYGLHCIRANF